jgi:DNA-binding NtrC family response regulator
VHELHDKVLARVERPLFDLVLAHTGGNQLKAAEILRLNRNTLRKKLAGIGIEQAKKRAGRPRGSCARRQVTRADRPVTRPGSP